KGAVAAVEHLFLHQVADAALHDAPSGGGAEEDLLLGAEQLTQHGLDLRVKVLEALAAVTDHRLAHGLVGGGRNFDGTGDVEFDVGAHGGRRRGPCGGGN